MHTHIHKQNKQTNKQTDKQTNKQTNKQTLMLVLVAREIERSSNAQLGTAHFSWQSGHS
jgi:hypothetical protein